MDQTDKMGEGMSQKWEPTPSDRVCLVHFEEESPNPSINYAYEFQVTPK